MDGASNDWISRKVRKIITTINPKDIIIHWSYTSRGELSDELISDEERRIPYANVFIQDQLDNLTKNLSIIEATTKFSNVIYSFIPNAIELLDIDVFFTQWNNLKGSDWPDRPPTTLTEFKKINSSIVQELKNVGINTDQIMLIFTLSDLLKSLANRYIPYFKPLDLARDGFHYDVLTARKFVDSIIDRLSFSS
jgi:hypothetical protein